MEIADQFEEIVSWARYLYWADFMHRQSLDSDEQLDNLTTDQLEWHQFAVNSHWLASMWVVVEGWQRLDVKDQVIDELIDSSPQYCDLLRRYRNCVFHYQPKLFDERHKAFVDEGLPLMLWVFNLYLEFQRYLWEWPEQLNGTKEQVQELRQLLAEAIGWMPTNIIPVYSAHL